MFPMFGFMMFVVLVCGRWVGFCVILMRWGFG